MSGGEGVPPGASPDMSPDGASSTATGSGALADSIEALLQDAIDQEYPVAGWTGRVAKHIADGLLAEAEEVPSAARMEVALRRIADAPAWGYPERWETTPSEVRQLARDALTCGSIDCVNGCDGAPDYCADATPKDGTARSPQPIREDQSSPTTPDTGKDAGQ